MSTPSQLLAQAAPFHPLSFLTRSPDVAAEQFLQTIKSGVSDGALNVISSEDGASCIYYRRLEWDTEYFGVPTYRVDFFRSVLDGKAAVQSYRDLLQSLQTVFSTASDRYYVFAEVPSDATLPLQGACQAGWRLVESRMTYFNDRLRQFDYSHRFAVRQAGIQDIANLREVAATSRNAFDRFHADHFFSSSTADAYLAKFVENSVKGFADVVLVPAVDDLPPEAFLTGDFVPETPILAGRKLARMVLSAVGEKRRGWYVKLIAEMSQHFKAQQVDTCFMTTQSTNRAVIRTWEKLGYSFGRCAHLFVMSEGSV